jgi:hypothetical protein
LHVGGERSAEGLSLALTLIHGKLAITGSLLVPDLFSGRATGNWQQGEKK